MNISRYANIDKLVNFRYIFLLARRTYSWLFQLAQMWQLLAPGVGLGDFLTPVNTTLCDKICQWLSAGRWFSPVSSTNKTDCHDITEILLIVVLNTINQNPLISHSLLFPSFFNKISFSFIQCFHVDINTILW